MTRNRPKKFRYLLFGALAITAAAVAWIWNRPGRDIRRENAVSIPAADLYQTYLHAEDSANRRFLDKAIRVNGRVNRVASNVSGFPVVFLETGSANGMVQVTLRDAGVIQAGDSVTLLGRCTGLLADVVLIDGYILTRYTP